jgi:hypothetical protein
VADPADENEQWIRNYFDSDSDDSDEEEFRGFQNNWVMNDFVHRETNDYNGDPGASLLHPPDTPADIYFEQFIDGECWQRLIDEMCIKLVNIV